MSHADTIDRTQVTGAILAGGRAQRMDGADKGLVVLAGKPLLAHVLARLEPQTGAIVINANRNIDRYATFGYPVVVDEIGDFAGPLAGIHACLAYAATRYVATVPCDTPSLPEDLVPRLATALTAQGAHAAVARTGTRMQPVVALYDRIAVQASLAAFLRSGARKVEAWQDTLARVIVEFGDEAAAFRNINTPGELAASSS